MAAAAGSSFSTSMHIRSNKTSAIDPLLLKMASFPPISTSHASRRWKIGRRIVAAVELEQTSIDQISSQQQEQDEEEEESSTGGSVNTKLYFGNLPYNCDSAQLAGIIQNYASPELIEVLYNRDTGRSRGFAFVTMSNIQDCNEVIQNLDGSQYGGRTLRVNFSDKPKPKEPLYPETEYKLFVGNLAWSVTSETLTKAFQEYGNLVGARVLIDGETGRSRGYGFVSYSTKSEMDAALEAMNEVELEGRAIRVSPAEGKKAVTN
ncbi:28 kDa ribonucleoprotein, chloroplastic-like isoform X2 [Impatiens glandulifera]|uniref:28 kDa ribonucleoprotein, chloroplastic-like isoform X2 n=1 Tax=Impatiens glandulifera TaxID=253017 RepID=UPI001FB09FFD|nr:28 kDa ribonucleoprotein, chloroplastic-like isoform X2 [Impatiens glandulifera]